MNFIEAVAFCFKNYFNFEGRAERSQFWYWQLFMTLFSIIWIAMLGICITKLQNASNGGSGFVLLLIVLVALALSIPSYAVGARRFHDMDRSGWWQLIVLIPSGIGFLVFWIWCSQAGTKGPNRFGPDPLGEQIEN